MLDETKLSIDANWDETLPKIISNPIYRSIRPLNERKRLFHLFMDDKRKNYQEDYKKRRERLKGDFERVLNRRRDITPDAKWKYIYPTLKHEPIMRLIDSQEAESLFTELIDDLRKRNRERDRSQRNNAKEKIIAVMNVLKSNGVLTYSTSWKEARDLITQSSEFQDEMDFDYLEDLDFLKAYEEFFNLLVKEQEEIIDGQLLSERNIERKNRQDFILVLKSLGINCKTKWKDFYPNFKHLDCYISMVAQSGSTPLELFWDILVEMQEIYRKDQDYLDNVIKTRGLEFSKWTTFREFKAVFSDQEINSIAFKSMEIYYGEMIDDFLYVQLGKRRGCFLF